MKDFTKEMLEKINQANESVKGTIDYTKYTMQIEFLSGKQWKFLTWGIPNMTGTLKTVKGNTYIITKDSYGDTKRYTVTDKVREILVL